MKLGSGFPAKPDAAVVAGGWCVENWVIKRLTIHTLGREYKGSYLLCTCIWVLFACAVPWIQSPAPIRPKRVAPSRAGDKKIDVEAANGDITRSPLNGTNGANGAICEIEGRPERLLWHSVKQPQCYIAIMSTTLSYSVMATVTFKMCWP